MVIKNQEIFIHRITLERTGLCFRHIPLFQINAVNIKIKLKYKIKVKLK